MSGVWVVGPSRSGTSMTAGLFAAHGVFFGDCMPADGDNPKGYFENLWLKENIGREPWPRAWFDRLEAEGWGGGPWGAKTGPEHTAAMLATDPAVVVRCYRPVKQVTASRRRHSWMAASTTAATSAYRRMKGIPEHAEGLVVDVPTHRLAQGETHHLTPAFAELGVRFDHETAADWIDPELWHG